MLASFSGSVSLTTFVLLAVWLICWNVVKNERDSIVVAHVHDAVFHLVVDFVGIADGKLVRLTGDCVTNSGPGRNWHMDTMTHVKRL